MWDATSKKTLSVIKGFHSKGVCAVNFSCSGKMLLSVGIDDQHSVAVWRWQEGKKSDSVLIYVSSVDEFCRLFILMLININITRYRIVILINIIVILIHI